MKYLANHTQDEHRAAGGSISVESEVLCFTPNALDIKFGGRTVEIHKDEIKEITVEPRKFSLKEIFSGGIRDRMKIVRKDGTVELFVLNRLHSVISALREWHNQPKWKSQQAARGNAGKVLAFQAESGARRPSSVSVDIAARSQAGAWEFWSASGRRRREIRHRGGGRRQRLIRENKGDVTRYLGK